LEDNVLKNYSVEWLPHYDELRTELISTWRLMERRRKEDGKNHKGGHPALPILAGHDQPGPHQRKCYGCGQLGHIRGDPSCSAGPNGVWDGAPQVWKDRIKKSGTSSNGKGQGDVVQRNKAKRDQGGKEKLPCHNWTRGNGFCKYAEHCRYSHAGPQAGQGGKSGEGRKQGTNSKRKSDSVFLATKKGKKARKKLTTLLLNDLKDNDKGKSDRKDSDEDSSLYQLIRGVPTVIIKSNGDEFNNFVPQRELDTCEEYMSDDDCGNREYYVEVIDGVRYLQYRTSDGEGTDETDDICDDNNGDNCDSNLSRENDTTFTVTLMMSNFPNDKEGKDKNFAPRRPGIRTGNNDQSKEESSSENNGRVIKNDTKKLF
jgi:hypothetical protein